MRWPVLALVAVLGFASGPSAAEEKEALPLLFSDDFEHGADHWVPTDKAAWKIAAGREGHVYSQFLASKYEPPYRSPFNFSLIRDLSVSDFTLTVKARSTRADYDHRDLCVIFGYQDPAHFYYVHLGKKTDDHANQIFIVNGAARTKISTQTSAGTPWDDAWHQIKLTRQAATGDIRVFFDDFEKPVMTARDTTFGAGQVGLGSFDDTGDWDDVKLWGKRADGKP
ncbi:MAG TPA: hypothetical protein VHC22_06860 [Pirellulales bacterium]|nr:hypothetical protein [Pirellulales bacterium]